ncbi:MAG: glutathione S-transferase family protein [Halioglobus sp.]|nr:glutathione S-transferase family protein [Halioglobus sp.]
MNQNTQKPLVYGGTVSPYVRKVRVALAYKGVEFEDVEQTPFGAPSEFRELSPLSKIPVWKEGDFVLPDSSVILSYIEQRYPEPPLLPADPQPRARALWFQEYGGSRLNDVTAGVFFERVVKPKVLNLDTDTKRVDRILEKGLPWALDYLTKCLGDDEYMVGGMFSLADIALTTSFVNLNLAGVNVDATCWPAYAAYLERIYALPFYAPIVADVPTWTKYQQD